MIDELKTIVVIGGGQAGGQVVATLRSRGFDGAVHLIAAEPHHPYERPPLSKGVLTGDTATDRCLIKNDAFYEKNHIELHLGVSVTEANPKDRAVRTTNGSLRYDALFLCTGSKLLTLDAPGGSLDNVLYLRTWADAEALRPMLESGAKVVVIGGGYIGLEVAAAARKKGASVTVLEAGEEVMARAVAAPVGALLRKHHEAHGVTIVTRSRVTHLEGTKRVEAVVTEDGRRMDADVVVVGIGVQAETSLAQTMGLAGDDGIVVDGFGRTADPRVFAAGDVTKQPNPYTDGLVRLESWQNAQFQAMAAAKAALGDTMRPHAMVPWFWSDQGDLNIQLLGSPKHWDSVVFRGNEEEIPASVFYLRDKTVVAHNALNAHDDVRPAKRLIEQQQPIAVEKLSDPAIPLTDISMD